MENLATFGNFKLFVPKIDESEHRTLDISIDQAWLNLTARSQVRFIQCGSNRLEFARQACYSLFNTEEPIICRCDRKGNSRTVYKISR